MLLADLVSVSAAVSETRSRTAKVDVLAGTLRRLRPEEAPIAVSFLSGSPTQSRLGVGYATVYGVEVVPSDTPELEIVEVDSILTEISETSGSGSKGRRETLLANLFGRATDVEQEFLRGLILRNLRQGALQGVMADALAVALGVPSERVRRAAMLEGDLVVVASRALAEGPDSLGSSSLTLFTPVQPMLAKTAQSAGDAVEGLGQAIVEQKLDGLRVQVHRDGDRVAVFSRNLRDITAEMPGVVSEALALPGRQFILDGEGLIVGSDGRPLSFQDTMLHEFPNDSTDKCVQIHLSLLLRLL
jgi:DNA ligase-1